MKLMCYLCLCWLLSSDILVVGSMMRRPAQKHCVRNPQWGALHKYIGLEIHDGVFHIKMLRTRNGLIHAHKSIFDGGLQTEHKNDFLPTRED